MCGSSPPRSRRGCTSPSCRASKSRRCSTRSGRRLQHSRCGHVSCQDWLGFVAMRFFQLTELAAEARLIVRLLDLELQLASGQQVETDFLVESDQPKFERMLLVHVHAAVYFVEECRMLRFCVSRDQARSSLWLNRKRAVTTVLSMHSGELWHAHEIVLRCQACSLIGPTPHTIVDKVSTDSVGTNPTSTRCANATERCPARSLLPVQAVFMPTWQSGPHDRRDALQLI